MPSFAFTVPGSVPGVNHSYKIVYIAGHARLAKHAEVEAWQTEVAYRARMARPRGWVPTRRVQIDIEVWFNREGRDGDGIVKALLDGIASGLEVNDKCFLHCVKTVEVDRINPRVQVEIRSVP